MRSKKRRAPRRSSATSQKRLFPVGALAAERAVFKKECLLKSKELGALKKIIKWLEGKVSCLTALTKYPGRMLYYFEDLKIKVELTPQFFF